MIPDVSNSVPKYPRILGMSQDSPGCVQGWSQMHPCLSPYPGILSILGYSGYPGMVPDASKSVPNSRLLRILGYLGYPGMVPDAFKSVPLSWDT